MDDSYFLILRELVNSLTGNSETNHKGHRSIDNSIFVERVKKELNIGLTSTHFERFEQKGLYLQRKNTESGSVALIFDECEARKIYLVWRILREIDRWNEKGYVDLNEEEISKKLVMLINGEKQCPSCEVDIMQADKFCSACGFKLAG